MSAVAKLTAHYRAVRLRIERPAPKPVGRHPLDDLSHYAHPIGPPRFIVLHWRPMRGYVQDACDAVGVTYADLMSRSRADGRPGQRARVYHLLRERGMSMPVIARLCGKRDHTTILHSLRVFDRDGNRRSAQ